MSCWSLIRVAASKFSISVSDTVISSQMPSEQQQRLLTVVSSISPQDVATNDQDLPLITPEEQSNDSLDDFNHPRYRKALILQALACRGQEKVSFSVPPLPAADLTDYLSVHSNGLIDFLSTAWTKWDALGEAGQDPSGALSTASKGQTKASTPALIPINTPLMCDGKQRPSKHVMGQVGYYATDHVTPIFESLLPELCMDSAIVEMAVNVALESGVAYALPTHPGHHAAEDSFGGYCYVNHAARAARLLQTNSGAAKVAILDIDYHCGNGTASIFYKDPSVLVVSIHCDPDWDYPFHSGFADETGAEDGKGATLHLPLPPGTKWTTGYRDALVTAANRIVQDFEAKAVVVSLGLDTYENDPCTIRRAGFNLSGKDYWEMGQLIGEKLGDMPMVFVQEGGYRMDVVGTAAADIVVGFCSGD